MTLPIIPPNPLTEVPEKTYDRPFIDYKARDIEAYNNWKEKGDKASLGVLMRQLHPIVFSEVRRASGTLPEHALAAEAKYWTVRAIETFDPTKGVALSTHVTNYLPKIRRLNYKYANAARLPENLHLQFTEYQNAVSHLENTHNREPTSEEVAKQLGWSKGAVVKYKGSLYEDLMESAASRPTEVTQFNSNKFLLDHIMDKLDEQEKTLLLNKGEMSATLLAAKLGVNVSRLNYLSAKLRDKIIKIKAEIGMY